MKKTGDAIGDFDGHICWLLRFSSRNSSSCFCSTRASGYTLLLKFRASGTSSLAWSHCFQSGNFIKGFFGKDVPKLLVQFGYYVLEVCGQSASCGFSKSLGDGLGCSDFLLLSAYEPNEKSVAFI